MDLWQYHKCVNAYLHILDECNEVMGGFEERKLAYHIKMEHSYRKIIYYYFKVMDAKCNTIAPPLFLDVIKMKILTPKDFAEQMKK